MYDLMPDDTQSATDWLDESFSQTNSKLSSLGYSSGSMIDNYLFFFLGIAQLVIVHILYKLVNLAFCSAYLKNLLKEFKANQKLSFSRRVQVKIYRLLHLGVYVTGVLEALIFLYLNCLSEIGRFDITSKVRIASLSFSLVLF